MEISFSQTNRQATRAGLDADAERAILRRCLTGDWTEYKRIVERYQRLVWAAVEAVASNQDSVPELVHESFVRAYQKLHLYQFRSSFASWLYRLARNHALSAARSAGRRVQVLQGHSIEQAGHDSVLSLAVQPESVYLELQRSRALRQMLAELPARYHEVLVLYYFQEMSYEQIAAALALPVNTVRTHLRRARLRLMELASHAGWTAGVNNA